jgi:(1->4)-alpha-D-glucan 1-alpha-D-glucosylmutase
MRGEDVITVVPRLTSLLGGGWGDTALALPPGRWTKFLSGGTVAGGNAGLPTLLQDFPVALLVRDYA